MLNAFKWDEYFMTIAYLVASKSKDPRTKVGAVIVGPNNEIRSTGYNGLPREVEDNVKRYHDRNFKLKVINHAEENAILNCARVGISLENCTIYIPWFPCANCGKAIIQVGIKTLVYDINFPGNYDQSNSDWLESMKISRMLLNEAKISIKEFNGNLIKIDGLYRGKSFDIYNRNTVNK